MTYQPDFPTIFHRQAAEQVKNFFLDSPDVDTVLLVNSCARGQAVPESDLDFAILAKPGATGRALEKLDSDWRHYAENQPDLLNYNNSGRFAHLHLDIISGNYVPTILETGVASDFFEIEIGNQICHSAPLGGTGAYFQELQQKWLPYYDEPLRLQRLDMCRNACAYDLDHLPVIVKRGLYFHAFDILWKAFQEYLQVLFIANRTYPIAYNKWIKMQVAGWLGMPDLYAKLAPVLSIGRIESAEILGNAALLRALLDEVNNA